MSFGSTTKVLAKRLQNYYRISRCQDAVVAAVCEWSGVRVCLSDSNKYSTCCHKQLEVFLRMSLGWLNSFSIDSPLHGCGVRWSLQEQQP